MPNLEFFNFSFLLFIAFLVNSNFEFFKIECLKKIALSDEKKVKYFLYIKILFVYL